ncbi:MAG: hypothetical protein R3B13_22000 [Polyangiaceae bacterium]
MTLRRQLAFSTHMARCGWLGVVCLVLLSGCGSDERWVDAVADSAPPGPDARNWEAGDAPGTDAGVANDARAEAAVDGALSAPAACRVKERLLLGSGKGLSLTRVLRRGSELAVLWRDLSMPRLSLSSVSQPSLVAQVALPVPDGGTADLTVTPTGYAVAVRDPGDYAMRVFSLTTEWSEVQLPDQPTTFGPFGIGSTPTGTLIFVWSEKTGADSWYTVKYRSAHPGAGFGVAQTLSSKGIGKEFEFEPRGSELALAWVEVMPSRSTMKYTRFDAAGTPAQAAPDLTNHDRYVYDVGIAHGPSGVGIAFTDSRVDILNVPLYFTTLDAQGARLTDDERLSFSGEHEHVDLAWVAGAYRYVYLEFQNGPGSQIKLLDLDEGGKQLAPPLQLSLATYLEYGAQTRVGAPKIVDDGSGGALVIWPELVDKDTYALKAVQLDCSAHA